MEKKYESAAVEQKIQQLWAEQNIYKVAASTETATRPLYSIDTPPPTVSGSLHIGHIFSYTQTDIIARYKRLSGFAIYYPFGFDDNGLPTERFVEKKKNVVAHQLSRSDFIKLCLEETVEVEDQFKALWQRMGLSVDWSKCYATIDVMSRRISQESFIELYKKGFVYRKNEPALYCTACRTSVAQAELDDAEQPSVFYDIKFTVDQESIVIATTRPELLPSCVAIFYHPDDVRYQRLAGKMATVPLFGNQVPVLADETVLMDKGTGLVMCCTFGDKTDIAWYKKYNLPYRPSVGRDGRWLPTTGILAGLKVKPAREAVVAALTAEGLVVQQRAITHAVNVHERCKNSIEFLELPQWFLKLLPYKKELLACADEINWYPQFMKARYKNWVENISWDWCLSRQRFYGIPFPAWHCEGCGHTILAKSEQLPLDPQETAPIGNCPSCNSSNIVADTDVMDTWNTSSLTPYICKALYEGNDVKIFDRPYEPMGMRPQAHDIIRTWAFYTIAKTWMHHGTIPWKDIVISGHVLSGEKEKISKSRENSSLQPEQLLNQYSADVIRYWTASGTLGSDIAFSENQLKIGGRLVVKLWNASLFIAERGAVGTFGETIQGAHSSDNTENSDAINNWIKHQATVCFAEYQRYFDKHEFGLALNVVEKFFWHDWCDNYLELVKDQFFNPGNYRAEHIAATQRTLLDVGLRILQLYAPFMPHITEAIYQEMYKQSVGAASLHLTEFATVQKPAESESSVAIAQTVLAVVAEVRRLKTDQKLSLKTELAELVLVGDAEALSRCNGQVVIIKGATRALEVKDAPSGESLLQERDGRWYATVALP